MILSSFLPPSHWSDYSLIGQTTLLITTLEGVLFSLYSRTTTACRGVASVRQRRQLPSLIWCAHRLLYIGVVGCYCSGSVIPTQYLPSSSFSIQRALQFRMLKPTQHNSSCRTHLYTYCNQYAFTVTHSPQRACAGVTAILCLKPFHAKLRNTCTLE